MSAPDHRSFWKTVLAENDLVAAPMAGVTTPPFRALLRRFFDGVVFTEMVSIEGLRRRIPKTVEYVKLTEKDHPIIVQLFGRDPRGFFEAVRVTETLADPAGYDVNMGCPVKKVCRAGGGSTLLSNLDAVHHIAANMRAATDKPISLKIRLGMDMDSLVYRDIAMIAEQNGVDALIVHGRTKREMFSGGIHYEILAEMAATTSIPIIGNGNVDGPESYRRMKDAGVAGVMIGRAMMKMPWIFAAIRENADPATWLTPMDARNIVVDFLEAEKAYRAGKAYLEIVKKHAVWFMKGFPGAAEFRRRVFEDDIDSDRKLVDLIDQFMSI